ncbi:Fucolectin-5 [Dissostichus eleginoides]|uniref:Fucolectin-5 n=1 Tax=Dissostichus eleginoides TaxID=100907 RepID=A0AAD9C4I4_DISEL|nr:Fucolectin-5 [Dissostichus eleginoides]
MQRYSFDDQPLVESGPAGILHRHLHHHHQQRRLLCRKARRGRNSHWRLFARQWCRKPSGWCDFSHPCRWFFTMTFTEPVEGLYVSVVLPGSKMNLTLCEVEVYGYRAPTGANLALQGKASQSSVYNFQGLAYNAIDGNRDSAWSHGSCTHTQYNLNPWWRLDLVETHKIFSVKVTNNIDNGPYRLNGAEIRIGDSLENNGNSNPRCALISSIPAGFTETFECNGMDGRYVNIFLPGRNEYLLICEVEVYGSKLD